MAGTFPAKTVLAGTLYLIACW